MRWAEIKAVVADESAETVASIFMEEGCGGVAITGPSVRASGHAELSADLPVYEHATLTAYLPVDDRLEGSLQRIRDRMWLLPEVGVDISPGELSVKPVDEADWASAWKSYFKPIQVGRVFIKPSWEDVESTPESIVVEIDPGMAFGTGNHPTTQLCIQTLQKYITGGERLLDVGTGSGILAIAAAKLGAKEVQATENDPVAVEAARNNVAQNGVAETVSVMLSESPPPACVFDIVVANITANTIIGMVDDLAAKVDTGGLIVASGIIESRSDEVAGHLADRGLEMVEKTTDDEWVALVMRKRG